MKPQPDSNILERERERERERDRRSESEKRRDQERAALRRVMRSPFSLEIVPFWLRNLIDLDPWHLKLITPDLADARRE